MHRLLHHRLLGCCPPATRLCRATYWRRCPSKQLLSRSGLSPPLAPKQSLLVLQYLTQIPFVVAPLTCCDDRKCASFDSPIIAARITALPMAKAGATGQSDAPRGVGRSLY